MTTKQHDAADAADKATELAGPAAHLFTAAAIRDYCRRTAHDMGIPAREVHPALIPTIAAETARRLQKDAQMDPQDFKKDVAALLEPHGYTARPTGREHRGWFEGPDGTAEVAITDEEIRVSLGRRSGGTVETYSLDRPSTTAGRLARIILAATAKD